MQEEVEQRSLTLVINSGKMTGRVLKSAIVKLMAHNRQKAQGKGGDVRYAGKQTLRQLIGQNQGVSNVEIPRLKRRNCLPRFVPVRCACCWAVRRRWALEPTCSGCSSLCIIWTWAGGLRT